MKTVYRINDGQYNKIGEHESWFHDMAEKGLHLREIGKRLVCFDKGEPKETAYRILIVLRNSLTKEKKEEYAEKDWTFITTYNGSGKLEFAVFSSPAEKNAAEIESAPEVLDEYYYPGKKAKLVTRLIAAVLLASMFALVSYFFLFRIPLLIQYIDAGHKLLSYYGILLIPVPLWVLYVAVKIIVFKVKTKNVPLKIPPIDHSAPWVKMRRKGLRQRLSLLTTDVLMLLILFLSGFWGEYTALPGDNLPPAVKNIPFVADWIRLEEKNLSAGTDDFPVIRLADIERDLQYEKVPASMSNGIDLNNSYSYTTTNWLASFKLFSFENGSPYWKNGIASFPPYLATRVYKLKYEAMSSILASDLAKELKEAKINGNAVKISNPAFDKLMVHENEYFISMIAAKGKGVIFVLYSGDAELDTIISAVAVKMDSISD